MTINFLSSKNFNSMKDIGKICNLMMDLLKFIFNTTIFSEVVTKLWPIKDYSESRVTRSYSFTLKKQMIRVS